MKKIVGFIFVSLVLSFNSMAQELWKEGTHYNIIAKDATANREIMEFFSFWCPHCYNFEPIVAQLKKQIKDEDIEFKKIHVNFMRSASPSVQDDATRAMLVGRTLKQEPQIVSAIFNHIHKQRRPITGLDDMKNMLIANGIDAAKFEKQAKSFGVNSLLNRNNGEITKFQRHLRGVPTFIVNGKYQAVFKGGMTPDDMVDLLIWLSKQK
ncbi:thiol:disulfide interchange protein DsbA/DsbL [Alteromonadaceae bacterium M269]|nr:thiol:disulfide interchange protein DsbA/DsbL [Alteromonadaceae bacterium M269]